MNPSMPATATMSSSAWRVLLADLRWSRLLHYIGMLVLGAMLAGKARAVMFDAPWIATTSIGLAWMALATVAASVFASVRNDLADLAIDRISNPDRPLVAGRIAPGHALGGATMLLAVALATAAMLGPWPFLLLLGVTLVYEAYSRPPWRLKRVPFLAKLLIGLNSALLAMAGFSIAGGPLPAFPATWALYLVFGIGLAANFVDFKDTAGDRAAGIRTLPVWWGEARAQGFVIAATVLAYVAAGVLLGSAWLVPANLVLLGFHIRALRRQPWSEAAVFRAHLASIASLLVALPLTCLPGWQ